MRGLLQNITRASWWPIGLAARVSDRDAKTPVTPSDRLMMGSAGKTYVASVAMQFAAD